MGELAHKRLRGQGCCQTALTLRSYRSDKEPAYRCAATLTQAVCPLSRACARQLPQRGSPWQAGPLPTGCPRPDMAQKGGPCYRGPRPAGCERQRSRRWEPQPGLLLVISVLHPLSSRNTRSLALNPDIRPFQSFLFCATPGTLLFTGMKRLFLPAVSCFLMKTPPCS